MQESTVLLSWGPPRMGTTWLFNVLRRMADEAGVALGVVADGVDLPSHTWTGPVIIKSHRADDPALLQHFDSELDLQALVMMRDPETALASLLRTQSVDLPELISWLEADVASYQAALPALTHAAVIREEWVAERAPEIIEAIAGRLGLDLTGDQIRGVAAAFDREEVRRQVAALEQDGSWQGDFSNYDRQTQWHAGHIGPDGPRAVELSDADAARVTALRAAIDDLTGRYDLWSAAPERLPASQQGACRPMEFVLARQEQLSESRPTGGLRRLLGRVWPGRA